MSACRYSPNKMQFKECGDVRASGRLSELLQYCTSERLLDGESAGPQTSAGNRQLAQRKETAGGNEDEHLEEVHSVACSAGNYGP